VPTLRTENYPSAWHFNCYQLSQLSIEIHCYLPPKLQFVADGPMPIELHQAKRESGEFLVIGIGMYCGLDKRIGSGNLIEMRSVRQLRGLELLRK
jgi:hypothetical protein